MVWFIGGGIWFVLLLFQSLLGRFSPSEQEEVRSLFLPLVIPTLTLMIGTFATDAFERSQSHATVKKSFFRLTLGLSIGYLTLVGLPLLLIPFSDKSPIALLRESQLWLIILHGLVSIALGAFFVHKPKEKSAQTQENE